MVKFSLVFIFLICVLSLHAQEAEIRCGSKDHWRQYYNEASKPSQISVNELLLKIHIAFARHGREWVNGVLNAAPAKRGPQAYKSLAIFGEKLEKEFNCTNGVGWFEQLTQDKLAFDCDGKECNS